MSRAIFVFSKPSSWENKKSEKMCLLIYKTREGVPVNAHFRELVFLEGRKRIAGIEEEMEMQEAAPKDGF